MNRMTSALGISFALLLPQLILGQKPNIEFTKVPTIQPQGHAVNLEEIQGTVTNLKNPDDYKIVLYSLTNSWYVQPSDANYDTPLFASDVKGQMKWSSMIHPGTKYAALLVKKSFQVKSSVAPQLPGGDEVIAHNEVDGRSPQIPNSGQPAHK